MSPPFTSTRLSLSRISFKHRLLFRKILAWAKERQALAQHGTDVDKQEVTKRRMTYLYGENSTDDSWNLYRPT